MANILITELARTRTAKGLTQRELALALDIKPATLSCVENGWNLAWPRLRRDAARILGVSEAELFPASERVRRVPETVP